MKFTNNLSKMKIAPEILMQIRKQVNYIGLQNNNADGEFISVIVDGESYQFVFDREEALVNNIAPGCSSNGLFFEGEPIHSMKDGCTKLTQMLHLKELVSEDIFVAAVRDSVYYHNLLVSAESSVFLDYLLQNPPEVRIGGVIPKDKRQSTMQLIAKMAKSMTKWGENGFSQVDEVTYTHRINACVNCSFFKDPPDTLVYKLATLTKKERLEKKICGLCGCVISNKAKLPHENCPITHPHIEGMSMWEEPIYK